MDDPVYFEDYDIRTHIISRNALDVNDVNAWNGSAGRSDLGTYVLGIVLGNTSEPQKAPKKTFTWGDVNFIQEIVDGIGTGSRRARQDRLNKILDDEDKKKKLIHLICRIKGEKVYDDYTEVGSVEVDVDDVDLVVERMMGKKLKLEIKSGV